MGLIMFSHSIIQSKNISLVSFSSLSAYLKWSNLEYLLFVVTVLFNY